MFGISVDLRSSGFDFCISKICNCTYIIATCIICSTIQKYYLLWSQVESTLCAISILRCILGWDFLRRFIKLWHNCLFLNIEFLFLLFELTVVQDEYGIHLKDKLYSLLFIIFWLLRCFWYLIQRLLVFHRGNLRWVVWMLAFWYLFMAF